MSANLPVSHDRTEYRHHMQYSVRYDDLDTYRHVNNKAFLSYIEDARVRYLVDAGGFRHHEDDDIRQGGDGRGGSGTGTAAGIMVVHSSIDYLAQIHPFETVDVYTRTGRVGRSSITLHHLLIARSPARDAGTTVEESGRPPDQTAPAGETNLRAERIAAVSITVLASVDLVSGTSRPNDTTLVARIDAFETAERR